MFTNCCVWSESIYAAYS